MLKEIPGLDLAVTGSAEGKSYSLHIQGNDFAQLLEYSQKAKRLLAEIPGTVDVGISYKAGKPETRIQVDRDAAADLGVAPSSISNTLNMLFNGTSVGKFDDNGDRLDVKISVQSSQSKDLNSLSGIYLPSANSGIMISTGIGMKTCEILLKNIKGKSVLLEPRIPILFRSA